MTPETETEYFVIVKRICIDEVEREVYEVFDLNRKKVCNIDPETGMVSYKFHGTVMIQNLPVGQDFKLVRDGVITKVLRDSGKTFTVELSTDSKNIQGIIRRRYDASGPDSTRISLFGDDPASRNVHSFDLVLKDGQYFIETKDSRGPKVLASAELIHIAMEQLSAPAI